MIFLEFTRNLFSTFLERFFKKTDLNVRRPFSDIWTNSFWNTLRLKTRLIDVLVQLCFLDVFFRWVSFLVIDNNTKVLGIKREHDMKSFGGNFFSSFARQLFIVEFIFNFSKTSTSALQAKSCLRGLKRKKRSIS